MFDKGAAHLIEGVDIDQPRNALSLTGGLHDAFGDFQFYFEPIADKDHTYQIKEFKPLFTDILPVTRTLHRMFNQTIDPPSPRLLAIHKAIGHILHLSAAGDYITRILEDREECAIRADGSTELGVLLGLGLRGWITGTIDTAA